MSVAEPARVVVVVGVPDFPQGPPAPVDLEHRAALEAWPRLEAREVLHDLAGIEEVAVVEQLAVEAGPVGQAPRVGGLAVHVHQKDGAVAEHRREEREARLGPRGIVSDEAGPRSPDLLLVHCSHGTLTSGVATCQKRKRRPARAIRGSPIEMTPSLVRPVV